MENCGGNFGFVGMNNPITGVLNTANYESAQILYYLILFLRLFFPNEKKLNEVNSFMEDFLKEYELMKEKKQFYF